MVALEHENPDTIRGDVDPDVAPARTRGTSRSPGASVDPAVLAEQHLARRIVIGVLAALPIGAVFYGALVAIALRGTDVSVPGAIAMGATVGLLAAAFWGFWIGLIASSREFEEIERAAKSTPAGPKP